MAVQFRFDGKTALVTGAGRGIGRAIAKALFTAGAETYALSRTQATLDSLVSEVVAKSLIERRCPGAIVNISSDSAYSAFPGCSAYCASKAALDMLSRVMAVELGRHQGALQNWLVNLRKLVNLLLANHAPGDFYASLLVIGQKQVNQLVKIRVNCVNPIVVTTDMANELDSTMLEAYKVRIPLGRFLDVSDVVNPVMFLLSDSSAMITGTSLVVDGGVTIHSAP